jgi:hypothetical protein
VKVSPSRLSRGKILEQLRLASRKGDRTALALVVDQMKTLAYSPRYWEKYLLLLSHPMARLVDLLVIKQGEKIARQKGWVKPASKLTRDNRPKKGRARGGRRRKPGVASPAQPSLFPELESR